jgi:hypothetical protein
MSADKPPPPKRRVRVRLTPRDKEDPEAVLAAVRNALSGYGICIEVRTVAEGSGEPTIPEPPADPPAVVKDELLETKARELAQAHLDAAAAEVEKKGTEHERDAERLRAEIAAQRAGFRAYVGYWLGQGVRITVEIYQKSVGAVVGAVSRALGNVEKN